MKNVNQVLVVNEYMFDKDLVIKRIGMNIEQMDFRQVYEIADDKLHLAEFCVLYEALNLIKSSRDVIVIDILFRPTKKGRLQL